MSIQKETNHCVLNQKSSNWHNSRHIRQNMIKLNFYIYHSQLDIKWVELLNEELSNQNEMLYLIRKNMYFNLWNLTCVHNLPEVVLHLNSLCGHQYVKGVL